jgi:hypothetical protein
MSKKSIVAVASEAFELSETGKIRGVHVVDCSSLR